MTGVRRKLVAVVATTLMCPMAAPASPEGAVSWKEGAVSWKEGAVSWKALTFRTKKLLMTATAEVRLAETSADELRRELATETAQESVVRLEIRSQLFGRRSTNQLWLDRKDGRAFKRRLVERGNRHRMKVHDYRHDGIHARRVTPADKGEAARDPESWTAESETFYPRSKEEALGPLTEPAAILYLVSMLDPSTFSKGLEISTFTKQRQLRTEIRWVRTEQLKTRYRVVGVEGEQPARTVEALVYSIVSHAPDDAESDFALLGLKGDIEIAVERASLIPLEIRGRIPPVGRVVVRLQRVELVR